MDALSEDAKAIELIQIEHSVSFANKRDEEEKREEEEVRLRATLNENPSSRRARLELSKFLFHQNKYTEARELSESILCVDSCNANALCLLGRIYGFGCAEVSDIHKSEEYFISALQSDESYAKAHYFYAYLLRSRLFRYDEAEEHYKSAMKLRPEDVTSYNDCAIMLVRQNRSSEAKRLYERVLELQPKHAIAHFNLANLLRKDLKDYKSAQSHFLASIKQRPKFTAALNNYATMLHHQLRRYCEAERYYLRALRIDNCYSRAHFNYANLCREHLNKYDLAQEHYLRAIMNDSENPNFYNNYGLLLQYALREYGKAKKQYEIALKLDDAHALGHCNYATILMQMVDHKYNKSYDDDTDTLHTEDSCDYTHFVLNDDDQKQRDEDPLDTERIKVYQTQYTSNKTQYFAKSEWHFKKSIALNASLVMAYNNYGCLLRRLKQYDNAKQMFAKALTIDPKFVMAKRNLERANQRENGNTQQQSRYAPHALTNRRTKVTNDACHVM